MDTFRPKRRRGGYKRPLKKPALGQPAISLTPEMLKGLEFWKQSQPSAPPLVVQFAPQPTENEKPLSQLIGEAILTTALEVYKEHWKKTNPDSYNANQAIYA